MQRSLLVSLLVLSISALFLSVTFDSLAGYFKSLSYYERDEEWFPYGDIREQPRLIFTVTPSYSGTFWRIGTADYYDGFRWRSTTEENVVKEFRQNQSDSAPVFTVEMNITEESSFLPTPSPESIVSDIVLSPPRSYELLLDDLADSYGIRIPGKDGSNKIFYKTRGYNIDYTEINASLISLDNIPQDIRSLYLQLPSLPEEVSKLAEELKEDSQNALVQILADVQYLRFNFDYDFSLWEGETQREIYQDWVLSYMQWGKGVCIDAATALTVILRCQGIPARVSYGFKPENSEGNKTYYYSTGAHAWTEVYLPSYGWISFDATPPAPTTPRLKVLPINAKGYLGEKVFCHLIVANKRETKDHFDLFVDNREKWSVKIIPDRLEIDPLENKDVLIEFAVPENASIGETNIFAVQVMSLLESGKFSTVALLKVAESSRIPTTTTIDSADKFVLRTEDFRIKGLVYTVDSELIDNVPLFILFSVAEKEEGIVVGQGSSIMGIFSMDCLVPRYIANGNHSVVTICLGDSTHAPSTSNIVFVEVYAKTYLEVAAKDPALVGDKPTIYGRLLSDDQNPVQNASITLEIYQNDSSTRWNWQTYTGNDGTFLTVFNEKFNQSGFFELNVTYFGDEFVYGSNVRRIIEVTHGHPRIISTTESTLVRGEDCSFQGKVYLDNVGLWKEPVTIMFDDDLLSTVETDTNGIFTHTFKMHPETELGTHVLTFTIQERKVSIDQEVRVMGKTNFSITNSDKNDGSEWVSVSLLDDQKLPVQNVEIFVKNYGLMVKTDNQGNASFILDTVRLTQEKIDLVLHFKGSELYLPTAASVTIIAEPVIPITFMLPFIMTVAIALALVTNRQLFHLKISKTSRETQREPLLSEPNRKAFMKILFPDIKDSFPNVWGIEEKLRVKCQLDKEIQEKFEGGTVDFLVNRKKTAKGIFLNGHATFSNIFLKEGVYEVAAKLVSKLRRIATAKETLRIVNYSKEIVSLYVGFLKILTKDNITIEDDTTAREIKELLSKTGNFDSESLDQVTDCFEKAEYSNHSITRKDYEIMYRALKELKFDVG